MEKKIIKTKKQENEMIHQLKDQRKRIKKQNKKKLIIKKKTIKQNKYDYQRVPKLVIILSKGNVYVANQIQVERVEDIQNIVCFAMNQFDQITLLE